MILKKIIPSILSINKEKVEQQLEKIKNLKIKYIHYDVMDEKFCGNKSFVTEYLNEIIKKQLKPDVHLMVEKPWKWLKKYKNFKLNSLGFHVETQSKFKSKLLLKRIRKNGFKSMISFKTTTDLKNYYSIIPYADIILIMSVEPGKGGQDFLDSCFENLKIANGLKKQHPNLIVQIDGGINQKIIRKVEKYVDQIISGSWFFKNIDKF